MGQIILARARHTVGAKGKKFCAIKKLTCHIMSFHAMSCHMSHVMFHVM